MKMTFSLCWDMLNEALTLLKDRCSTPLCTIPEYGDLMTVAEFKEGVEAGLLTDDDGHGCYATPHLMSDIYVYPSILEESLDFDGEGFSHVVWFNK